MTDHRTRLAAREPMTVEEEAEELLRRQRAGLIRQVDVGPCSACNGAARFVLDPEHWVAPEGESPIRSFACTTCNGTGRRYRSGLELAAFCGHEAARLALGRAGLAATLRYARTDEDAFAWWRGLHAWYGQDAVRVSYSCGRHTVPVKDSANVAKAALIRWALTEP